ncbi:SDR family oxidoreductase [Umezawaea beigongshangensis]|uniref:SDR family oxidoreductase n=1 Tax=Umezawaea beigongshangensis TaxID=2780383 RepID=UPI0018F1C018|nr:SDR family oxidoreductase [Umezawaea beigongshangensis]
MPEEIIAVTGATGQLGARVVRHLAGRGARQRLVVRDPARAPHVDGAETAVASFEDPAALTEALRGASTLFLVSGHEDPRRLDLHLRAVEAVAAAGVRRVVYTSFLGASPRATFTYARDHALTERAIVDSGVRLTALRNSLYADVAPHFVGGDGVLRGPAGNGRLAWVAREDVARLAAEVLLDASHAGQVYDVTGPVAIDLRETARVLGEVTGRRITYHDETPDEARASRAGAPEWQIDGWVGSYEAVATGETSVTSHTIEHLTGRRPWTLEEFLRAEPASWQHLV